MGLGGDGKTSEDNALYSSQVLSEARPHILAVGLGLGIARGFSHPYTSGQTLPFPTAHWLSQLGRWKPSRTGSLLWPESAETAYPF